MGKWHRAYRELVSEIKDTAHHAERVHRESRDPYILGAVHALHAAVGTAAEIEEKI